MSSKPGWATAADLRLQLKKKWARGLFLSIEPGAARDAGSAADGAADFDGAAEPGANPESLFPLRVPIKGPSPSQMTEQFAPLREWIAKLQADIGDVSPGIQLEWKEINHRLLGRNTLPSALILDSLESLSSFLGKSGELRRYQSLTEIIRTRNPKLLFWASSRPFELLDNGDVLERFLDIADWLASHPRPGIYLREVALPGVDTKFIETHKTVLSRILDIVLPGDSINWKKNGKRGFEARYGFLNQPQLVRFRLLDKRQSICGCRDLSIPAREFAELPQSVTDLIDTVYFVENDITSLAFPSRPRAMLIFGRGYNFDALSAARWLHEKNLFYWGDIDTHGFAILNQFRSIFPTTRSFLMDRETLITHKEHWGSEPSQASGTFSNLRPEETSLVDLLRANRLGDQLRLEQEFVRFDLLERSLK